MKEIEILLSLPESPEKLNASLSEENSGGFLLKFFIYTGKEDLFNKVREILLSRGKWKLDPEKQSQFISGFSNPDSAIWALRQSKITVTEI